MIYDDSWHDTIIFTKIRKHGIVFGYSDMFHYACVYQISNNIKIIEECVFLKQIATRNCDTFCPFCEVYKWLITRRLNTKDI